MKQYTTAQFATELGLSPETLRKAHSKTGSYMGVVPVKQVNGRLLWPADAVAKLKGGAA